MKHLPSKNQLIRQASSYDLQLDKIIWTGDILISKAVLSKNLCILLDWAWQISLNMIC